MRLWHKYMIRSLPKQQLLSQWRECCAIAARIAAKGTPDHILVNRVLDYPAESFVQYTEIVIKELSERGVKIKKKTISTFMNNIEKGRDSFNNGFVDTRECKLFLGWHDTIYLRECLYNLEEKYICGGVSGREWNRIYHLFGAVDLFIRDEDR